MITTQIYTTVSEQRLEDAIALGELGRRGGLRAGARR
jgi:hypothetical protein